jgi:hypothetical protein
MFSTMNEGLAHLRQNSCGGQTCELMPVGYGNAANPD